MTHASRKTATRRAPMDSMRKTGPRYDLILDSVGDHPMSATRRTLTSTGPVIDGTYAFGETPEAIA